ncbi:MAG: hypothetical protein KIS94_05630 [Chitinophagales bacterium]|nr:hypothetical protein [Chitinophagales bacterium]
MREVPFDTAPAAGDNYRVNLFDRIKTAARSHQESNGTPADADPVPDETTAAEQTTAAAEPATEPSATFEEEKPNEQTFDEFADAAQDKLEDFIENPEELSELVVELLNVGRIIWGPGLYEGLMFPGQERNDIREVVRKSIENEKQNKAPNDGFNNYEKRLYEKWPLLQESIKNISFSDEEIKKMSKYLSRDIQRVGIAKWTSEHMWLLYWLFLEVKHAKSIISGRSADAFAKKWGFA